ncbi:MAG: DUF3500 domain-containing protein [Fuerstia sp.]|nr:DUF3500 domain-containing protein [Fuerstiella sp.]
MPSSNRKSNACPDCSPVNRRSFVRTVAGASALALISARSLSAGLFSGPSLTSASETAVSEFFKSLTDVQKKTLCFPFEHELRHRISANWHVTEPTLGQTFYTSPQREMISRILKGLCSEEGHERMTRQMDDDAGGLHEFSVAMFGEPGAGSFEFMLTGRHLTLRADGNSVDKAAFGGPIVYGYDQIEKDASKNIYYYQTQQTDKVFKSLTEDQAAKALVAKAPNESEVQLQGESGKFSGIKVAELTSDQKSEVEKTLGILLAPYRKEDVEEVMEILQESGGVDHLHMAFFQQEDIGGDKTWDIWRVEGPSFVWHFRGAPHVHAYINIGHVKKA